MNKILFIPLLLVACGEGSKSSEDGPDVALQSQGQEIITESGETRHALLIEDASALPECVADSEGWLVYVKADAQFMACVSGAWEAIDLKGSKGDKGDAGEDGVAQSANTWLDPISGRTWLIGGAPGSAAGCGNGWSLPTYAELGTARTNGMYAAFMPIISSAVYECGWHREGGLERNAVKPGVDCAAKSAPFGLYCIKDEG